MYIWKYACKYMCMYICIYTCNTPVEEVLLEIAGK